MLAIGRILRTGARFLMLDEPTEGLAPVIIQQIGHTIARLKSEGFTILLVEQNFRFAATVADRYYIVEHGKIIDMASPIPSSIAEYGQAAYVSRRLISNNGPSQRSDDRHNINTGREHRMKKDVSTSLLGFALMMSEARLRSPRTRPPRSAC
jgi:ABC-type multidrug transport system ATPase subunit